VTPEITLVLCILAAAVIFLITEWIPMEVTALLSLGLVALTGLVTPVEALAGFSNPAVVTVWAGFIIYSQRGIDSHRRCQCHRTFRTENGRKT